MLRNQNQIKTQMTAPGRSAVLLLLGCFFTSCSSEKNQADKPITISPARSGSDAVSQNTPVDPNSPKRPGSPNTLVEVPVVECSLETTKNPQNAGENEKNGAVVTLAASEEPPDALLVYRLPGSITSNGSFLVVSDMIFGSSGTHPIGTYQFELHLSELKTCKFSLTISEEDAQNKHIIGVKASLPL